MPSVLMMAQGQQQRIGHLLVPPLPAFKQLLPISDHETIFSRSARLFLEAGAGAVIVIAHWHHEWHRACSVAGIPFLHQEDPGGSVLNGIYNTRKIWGPRTVIALGDVVFSRAVVHAMTVTTSSLVFGRSGGNPVTKDPYPEIYGITFSKKDHPAMLEILGDPGFRRHQDHKLWTILPALKDRGFMFNEVPDYTDDVDTEESYNRCFPILREAAARDS